jgi:hypothetical protein
MEYKKMNENKIITFIKDTMNNDFIIIIIAVFFVIVVATSFGNLLSKKEGLTSSSSSSSSGEAGLASAYAEEIKAKTVELQDTLLVAKYRKEYETCIINLDDYVGMLMIQQALNMKLDGGKELLIGLDALNTLKLAKDNLNISMEYLDKQ